MMSGIPEGIVALILTGIGVVAWYGITRIIAGQDRINETLTGIAEDISSVNSWMTGMETWSKLHEKQDDEWQEQSKQDRRDLWSALRKGN